MSKLQQLNIGFDATEDRLLLRVRSSDNQEVRLWLTRRYVRLLWGVIQDMLGEASPLPDDKPETRDAVLAFQQNEAIANTDFDTPYQEEVENRPLGDSPILVTEIRKRVEADGRMILGLAPKTGSGIELGCDLKMLHAIAKFLFDAVKTADWDLNLTLVSQEALTAVSTASSTTRH